LEDLEIDERIILKRFESNWDGSGLESSHYERETRFGRLRCIWNYNIKMNLIEIHTIGV